MAPPTVWSARTAVAERGGLCGLAGTHQHLPAAQWITRTLRGRPCKVEANTLVAQVSAISAGLGLGVLPHFMARASGLQCLQPEIGADQTLWLVMHSDLAGSRRVRDLADHLIALFADHQDRLAMPEGARLGRVSIRLPEADEPRFFPRQLTVILAAQYSAQCCPAVGNTAE